MAGTPRWDPCIAHRGDDVGAFVTDYFGQGHRKILLVAGAGFDPRACTVAMQLNDAVPCMRSILVKEIRPNPTRLLSARANANAKIMRESLRDVRIEEIDIFGSDGAVVGGRSILKVLSRERVDAWTDVVVDISALSVGTSFPIIRYFLEILAKKEEPANLHVFVGHDPRLDAAIRSTRSDVPGYVHGFKGHSTLSTAVDEARLWLPQLASGQGGALGRLHEFVRPHDTCPILPFPARDPRLGDVLAEEDMTELESSWTVDTRNIVYADEGDPLDLYRTILRLDDRRRPVFAGTGGSMLILSPLGSKVMALGALMAALERNLPVAHLEALGYEIDASGSWTVDEVELVHIWLAGEAYP